jgi:hypothetical protein
MTPRSILAGLIALTLAGCALYSDVSIQPAIVTPQKIERGADLQAMLRKADYLRAIEYASSLDQRVRRSPADLLALGLAEMACNRLAAARYHLRASITEQGTRANFADAAWALSQLEYMDNNMAESLEWAKTASDHGLSILPWHMQYLEALQGIKIYSFEGLPGDEIPFQIGKPDVPRIAVRVNRTNDKFTAVIDSGAALSIMSQRLANTLDVKKMAVEKGTFYGLLGEPISVDFALLDTLEIGAIEVRNVPVAIMPDEKMRFLVNDRTEFRIDFLLGANLLKEFRLEFNFTRSRVLFSRLTSVDKRPADDQNLFFHGFRPHVRGTINRHGWFLFVLDTGSEVTYLNETQIGSLPINKYAPRMHNATLQGLGGSQKTGAKLMDVELGIDRWAGVFRTIPMYAASERETNAGIIGQNYMKNFNMVIDFGRMRVDLARR